MSSSRPICTSHTATALPRSSTARRAHRALSHSCQSDRCHVQRSSSTYRSASSSARVADEATPVTCGGAPEPTDAETADMLSAMAAHARADERGAVISTASSAQPLLPWTVTASVLAGVGW